MRGENTLVFCDVGLRERWARGKVGMREGVKALKEKEAMVWGYRIKRIMCSREGHTVGRKIQAVNRAELRKKEKK